MDSSNTQLHGEPAGTTGIVALAQARVPAGPGVAGWHERLRARLADGLPQGLPNRRLDSGATAV